MANQFAVAECFFGQACTDPQCKGVHPKGKTPQEWRHGNSETVCLGPERQYQTVQRKTTGSAWPLLIAKGYPNNELNIDGEYEHQDCNHGKPMFKRIVTDMGGNSQMVMYYWDDRDGHMYQGWWIGPSAGDEWAWAFNGASAAHMPPAHGWIMPQTGTCMKTFSVITCSPIVAAIFVPGEKPKFPCDDVARAPGKVSESTGGRRARSRSASRHAKKRRENESSSEEEEGTLAEGRKAVKTFSLRKHTGATEPRGAENDPIYESMRQSSISPWPLTISKHKLQDAPYNGHGWPLRFRDPKSPMGKMHPDDFFRVLAFLQRTQKLEIGEQSVSKDGCTVTTWFGEGKSVGNVQFYVTQTVSLKGNTRIYMGAKFQDRLKMIRRILLTSAWFEEVEIAGPRAAEKAAEEAFKKDGRYILPKVSPQTEEKEVKKMMMFARARLGAAARKHLTEYLARCGFIPGPTTEALLDEVFLD